MITPRRRALALGDMHEEKNSGVETVKIPAHCRCHTTNKHGKLLKFRLKTHSTHKDSDN